MVASGNVVPGRLRAAPSFVRCLMTSLQSRANGVVRDELSGAFTPVRRGRRDRLPRTARTRAIAAEVRKRIGLRLGPGGGAPRLEVDAHHDPAKGRVSDLDEAGGREDAAAADMELSPGDLLPGLRDHRVALEGTGAAFSREIDGGAR